MNLDMLELSPATIRKGEKLIADDGVFADKDHRNIWWCLSSNGVTRYRVQADLQPDGTFTWVTCTCPHGMHSGGGKATCYHVAAALTLAESDAYRDHIAGLPEANSVHDIEDAGDAE
jgi:hypothetical protein